MQIKLSDNFIDRQCIGPKTNFMNCESNVMYGYNRPLNETCTNIITLHKQHVEAVQEAPG